MAEKNLKQQKRRGLSYLVLGFIIAVITILVFYHNMGDSEKKPPTLKINHEIVPAPLAIYNYLEYVEEMNAEKIPVYEYISQGLQLLTTALDELDGLENVKKAENTETVGKRNKLWKVSDFIQANPKEPALTDSIEKAFLIASEIIISIQERSFPELSSHSSEVLAAAELVNSEKQLSENEKQIQLFFEESADLIKEMLRLKE